MNKYVLTTERQGIYHSIYFIESDTEMSRDDARKWLDDNDKKWEYVFHFEEIPKEFNKYKN
jgi:hypothetical protein